MSSSLRTSICPAERSRVFSTALPGSPCHLPGEAFQAFLARLARVPIPPTAFGCYCDIVLAIEEDDLDGAQRTFGELVAFGPASGGLNVGPFGDPTRDSAAHRYQRLLD